MSFFPTQPKELPNVDCITARPSSRYDHYLVNLILFFVSGSMYNSTSSQVSAPPIVPIDTTLVIGVLHCQNVAIVVVHQCLS